MRFAFMYVVLVKLVVAQNRTRCTNDNFDCFVEVPTKAPESLGAIERCGEGSDQGVHVCVPYYRCDGGSNSVIPDNSADNDDAGNVDIRLGKNTCSHYLEVCCRVSNAANTTSVSTPSSTTTESLLTSPLVTTPTTTKPASIQVQNKCGIRNINGVDFRITGNSGNEAEYGEFPWMIAILSTQSSNRNSLICGGSLIAPNVVLTGAHCVYKYKIQQLKVRAGEWDTQTEKERLPHQERGIINIIIHENFNENNLFNDIALLILETPVQRAEHISPICLPQQNEVILSRNCFTSGWGKDIFGVIGKYQVILKKIELPMVRRDPCQDILRTTRLGIRFVLDNSFVCAGGEAGKDACTGDGGSPLVCPDPRNPSRYVQVGTVAWGIGCGENNIPGVYGNVAAYRAWIDGQLSRFNIDTSSYQV